MINISDKSWDKLRVSDIHKFLSKSDDESFFFEFKSDDTTPAKLAREISAFSNTYGGYIFLGINDDKSVGGCNIWTEQRVHTTIHDSITPVPNFDVKKFKLSGAIILVIKIEEGEVPPYITNKGQIFERVSSGSFTINDSGKLSQLYSKRKDQLTRTRNKIELDKLQIDSSLPTNLCGYLDLGFSTAFSEFTNLQKSFYIFDFSSVVEYIKTVSCDFSVSRLGHSVLISIGRVSATKGNDNEAIMKAGVHNFMEIMCDGSVRSRIILMAKPKDSMVDISSISYMLDIFIQVYKRIIGNDLSKKFIYAQKYERLMVINQFVPYYSFQSGENEQIGKILSNYLITHRNKYGNNLMIESNRVPKNDYEIIDKRWFDTYGIKYNMDNLVEMLFYSTHINLGYIDPMEIIEF